MRVLSVENVIFTQNTEPNGYYNNNYFALLRCIACADRSNALRETFDDRPVVVRCESRANIYKCLRLGDNSCCSVESRLCACCRLPHQLFGQSYASLTTSRVHRSFGRPTSTDRKPFVLLADANFTILPRDRGVGWLFKRDKNYFPSSLPVRLNLSRARHRGMPGENVFPAVYARRVHRSKPP